MAAYDLTYSTARVNNEPSNQIWPSSSYQRGPGLLSAFPPETVTESGSPGSRRLQTLDRARDPYVQNGTYAAQQSEVQHPAPAPPPQTHSANNSCSPPPSSLTSFYASSTSASTIMYASAELQLQLPSTLIQFEDIPSHACTQSPAMFPYHHQPTMYQPEYSVDQGLYYQAPVDYGHGQLHQMPFVQVDVHGRSCSPQTTDSASASSQSPYGSPSWHSTSVTQHMDQYFPVPSTTHYEYATAGPSNYSMYEQSRAELSINTSFNSQYSSYYPHYGSSSSSDSSPTSVRAPSPQMCPISPVSDSSESRAPASGPTRGGRRKGGSSATPKKIHECYICHKTMSRNYDLHRHLHSVHGVSTGMGPESDSPDGRKHGWSCQACGKCFSRKDSMQRHQRDDGCRVIAAASSASSLRSTASQ